MSAIFEKYKVNEVLITNSEDEIPLIYWPVTPNFGDLLSPWLFEKITGKPVVMVPTRVGKRSLRSRKRFLWKKDKLVPSYISIGSIISRVQTGTMVWGTGSFGDETAGQLNPSATYLAVRGPLTRNLLLRNQIPCPAVYGDPALLTPYFFDQEQVEKKFEVGVVLRWSEKKWLTAKPIDKDVAIIDLGSDDVESTLKLMLSCRRIVTSSLHGLIIADAYNIPNAWLSSTSPKGLEFKYYDYFLSVDKVRKPQTFAIDSRTLTKGILLNELVYDGRPIKFDYEAILDACPLLEKKSSSV